MTVQELHDEVCAMEAIYPGSAAEVAPQVYELRLPQHEVSVRASFPPAYPDEPPRLGAVRTTNEDRYPDSRYLERAFAEVLGRVYVAGQVCLFDLCGALEAFLGEYEAGRPPGAAKAPAEAQKAAEAPAVAEEAAEAPPEARTSRARLAAVLADDVLAGWTESAMVEDRGSKFVAFARAARSVEEAQGYLDSLLTHRKIQRAAHNMTSWRIRRADGVQFQDCDDDGEAGAGAKMLHLMQVSTRGGVCELY
jgi:hypothetical protein